MLGVRFWLDRGVDGFRVDVMHHLAKDTEFRDNPPNPVAAGNIAVPELLTACTAVFPKCRDRGQLRNVLNKYDDRMLVGEISAGRTSCSVLRCERLGAHLPFNFQLIRLPWNARNRGQWNVTRRSCRQGRGRTGYSAITTNPVSPRA